MEKNLYLIGYRGTGKTTIGLIVADILKKEFIDTDNIIVKLAKKSIPEIFNEDGEEKFREYETKALKLASQKENAIISCGGGIILKEKNNKLLKRGIVCLLSASEETIYNRIYKDKNRPALTNKDPRKEIHDVLEFRKPLYKKLADFEINTDKIGKEKHAINIIEKYKELLN